MLRLISVKKLFKVNKVRIRFLDNQLVIFFFSFLVTNFVPFPNSHSLFQFYLLLKQNFCVGFILSTGMQLTGQVKLHLTSVSLFHKH